MKFSLTQNTKQLFGITLYQIKAEKSFGNVRKGELGGWIEKKENLSEEGNSWVYGDAWVSGNAQVYGNARVYGQLQLTSGFFFGYKRKKEELKYFSLGDDGDYELVGKGNCKVEEQNNKKTELLRKAQELIDKAQELKNEANKL